MLKKIAFLLSILVFVPQPVYAIDYMTSSSASNMRPIKATIQNLKPTLRQDLTASRSAFRDQIKMIKDTRKKNVVENINSRITNVNKNKTSMMSESLKRFSNILSDLSSKSANFKSQGKDTTALDSAITSAQTALTSATAAVNVQAIKVYSAEIIDEATLRSVISQMVLQFKTDITATHQSVIAAKKAVVNAMREMAKLNGTAKTITVVGTE